MKIKIIDPVQHDGELLEAGSVVDLKDAAAKQLIACGAAAPLGKAKDAPAGDTPSA